MGSLSSTLSLSIFLYFEPIFKFCKDFVTLINLAITQTTQHTQHQHQQTPQTPNQSLVNLCSVHQINQMQITNDKCDNCQCHMSVHTCTVSVSSKFKLKSVWVEPRLPPRPKNSMLAQKSKSLDVDTKSTILRLSNRKQK